MCVDPRPVKVQHKGKIANVVVKTEYQNVPCGKCGECRQLRRLQWTFRLEKEADLHPFNYFVTLTYADQFLPHDGQLYKPDFQEFMKRFRKRLGHEHPIKFFACGEYGDTYGRCHWHFILFSDYPVQRSDVAACWTYGFNTFAPFTSSRAAYVAKYSQKQLHAIYPEGCVPPCSLSSKGLGDAYWTPATIKYYRLTRRTTVLTNNRQEVQMPRRYYQMVYSEHERERMRWQSAFDRIERELELKKIYGRLGCQVSRYETVYKRTQTLASKHDAHSIGHSSVAALGQSFSRDAFSPGRRYSFLSNQLCVLSLSN